METLSGAGSGSPRGRDLDPVDRQLLRAVQADPGAPLSVWAERIGVADRTAARRYRALVDSGRLAVRGRTLPVFDGRLAWLVRITGRPDDVAALGGTVARFPHSRWVRTSRDGMQLMAGLVTPRDGGDAVMHGLGGRLGPAEVRFHELLRVWGPPGAVTAADRPLDALDRRLLRVLAQDGRATLASLGRALGVDPTTAGRRRARLMAEGILYLEADVDPAALGADGDVMLWIRVRPGRVRALAQGLAARPEVRFVAATSGDASLAVHVVLPTAVDVVDFVDEELAGHGVESVETVPQGRTFKRSSPAAW